MANFCENLKELMLYHDYNTMSLGEELGISSGNISIWLNNNSDIGLEMLITLSNLFNVSIEFLSGRIEIDNINFIDTNVKFYDRLKVVLKEKNISEYRIAKDILHSKNRIFQWKNGSQPRLSSLIAIADYLDCTLDYLVGRE